MRHREPDPELEFLVRQALHFLFAAHGAQVVCSEKLPGIGNGQIFVRVGDMTIRVIQKDGSIIVLAAPCHTPNGWQAIELLLIASDTNGDSATSRIWLSLRT